MHLSRVMSLLLLVLSWASVNSALGSDVFLEDYPEARKMFSTTLETNNYLLALGSYKKVSGTWRLDHQERVSGELKRYTFELPATATAKGGYDFYVNQLKKLEARSLFSCVGRDCGTSNSWANNHFKILQLYGLDQHQYYGAFEVVGERTTYAAIYAVKRGNNRVYVQVDIVESPQPITTNTATAVDKLYDALINEGVFTVSTASDIELAVVAELLGVYTDLRLAIVGHNFTAVSVAEQVRLSMAAAATVKESLLSVGVEASRIEAYGVGSLSPKGRNSELTRIDIVKVDKH